MCEFDAALFPPKFIIFIIIIKEMTNGLLLNKIAIENVRC